MTKELNILIRFGLAQLRFQNQSQGADINEHTNSQDRTTNNKVHVESHDVVTWGFVVAPNESISVVVEVTAGEEIQYSMSETADHYSSNDVSAVLLRKPYSIVHRTKYGKESIDCFKQLHIQSDIIYNHHYMPDFYTQSTFRERSITEKIYQ